MPGAPNRPPEKTPEVPVTPTLPEPPEKKGPPPPGPFPGHPPARPLEGGTERRPSHSIRPGGGCIRRGRLRDRPSGARPALDPLPRTPLAQPAGTVPAPSGVDPRSATAELEPRERAGPAGAGRLCAPVASRRTRSFSPAGCLVWAGGHGVAISEWTPKVEEAAAILKAEGLVPGFYERIDRGLGAPARASSPARSGGGPTARTRRRARGCGRGRRPPREDPLPDGEAPAHASGARGRSPSGRGAWWTTRRAELRTPSPIPRRSGPAIGSASPPA